MIKGEIVWHTTNYNKNGEEITVKVSYSSDSSSVPRDAEGKQKLFFDVTVFADSVLKGQCRTISSSKVGMSVLDAIHNLTTAAYGAQVNTLSGEGIYDIPSSDSDSGNTN